jgi:hypothetical protein
MSSLKNPLTEEQKQEQELIVDSPTLESDHKIITMKKFTINDVSCSEYDMINFYIIQNMKFRLMDDKEKDGYDSNFIFPFETLQKITLNYINDVSHDKSRKKNIYDIGDTKGHCYWFSYKDMEYAFSSRVMGDIPLGCQLTRMYNELTIYYDDFTLLEDFIKTSDKYYEKYYKNIIKTSKKFDLYYNEGSYWERVGQKNKRNIDNIYMDKDVKNGLIKTIKDFSTKQTIARYERFGIPHKFVCLLYGLPGTGKTSLVKSVASMLDLSISSLTFNDKLDDSKMRSLIKRLPKKTILLIEDMDCLFKDRKKNDEIKNQITLSGILNCLDGLSSGDNMIVFITTNIKDSLYDEALIRPGRIDHFIQFTYIKKEQLVEMYKVFMENNYSEDKMNLFIKTYYSLNIKCTTALIQDYLFRYVDEPDDAQENIDMIKDIKNESTFDKYEGNNPLVS